VRQISLISFCPAFRNTPLVFFDNINNICYSSCASRQCPDCGPAWPRGRWGKDASTALSLLDALAEIHATNNSARPRLIREWIGGWWLPWNSCGMSSWIGMERSSAVATSDHVGLEGGGHPAWKVRVASGDGRAGWRAGAWRRRDFVVGFHGRGQGWWVGCGVPIGILHLSVARSVIRLS
jgi:hypothetical protein